jgi:glutamine synthetase
VSAVDLVTLATCDLGAIVRGRAVPAAELGRHLTAGVSWVPANQSLTPLGPLAEHSPFGSVGDLRLLPDTAAHVKVEGDEDNSALELILCDITETDGTPWAACPRRFMREVVDQLSRELSVSVDASFEHEFQLLREEPSALPFSLEAQRRAEPLPGRLMDALAEAGLEPERFFAEYSSHQFEVPVAPAEGLAAADRAVLFREVVRDVARRCAMRATFTPLLDPAQAGNGVHLHIALRGADGVSALYDPGRPGRLSEVGAAFAAGVLRHARALSALTAPSPVSATRLTPHRWSAGAVCLAERNREALLRIPPLVELGGAGEEAQMRLEYRGADASANPYLALGAVLRAGLEGVRAGLPAPPILDRDPGELDEAEAGRFGVGALPGSLAEALQALGEDDLARAWLPQVLYDAYTGIKLAELEAADDAELEEVCRRYARIY